MQSLELFGSQQSIFDDDVLDGNRFIAMRIEAVAADVNVWCAFNLGDGDFAAVSALEDNDVGQGKFVHNVQRLGRLACELVELEIDNDKYRKSISILWRAVAHHPIYK